MLPRIRRLKADFESVSDYFQNHPYIKLMETQGNPAERYLMEFHVTGLVPNDNGSPIEGNTHGAEIFLPMDYPRRPPICRMVTPIYHPNIDPQKICIGDHWSAGQILPHLIVRIAEMICFQSYNTKSPLNAEAAAWAESNQSSFPLMNGDLTEGL